MKRYIPIEKGSNQLSASKKFIHSNSEKLKKYYYNKEKYHSIDKNLLLPDIELIFSLFIQRDLDYEPLLEALENSPAKPTPEILGCADNIVIKTTDIPLYEKHIQSLNGYSQPNEKTEKIKASLVKEKSKIMMRGVLLDPKNSDNIKKCSESVEEIANLILNNKEVFYSLISIKTHDYYTYIHSVNVAILSIGIGIASGLSSTETFNLGLGAMLHDIGKCNISPEILNKVGRLTATEYKIMKNHVIEGERILKEYEKVPEDAFTVVIQHHEKLSGKGYPSHLTGAKISKYGKITAITDCYDALTTPRPYKSSLTPFQALSILVNECEDYDSDLLRVFIKLIGGIDK